MAENSNGERSHFEVDLSSRDLQQTESCLNLRNSPHNMRVVQPALEIAILSTSQTDFEIICDKSYPAISPGFRSNVKPFFLVLYTISSYNTNRIIFLLLFFFFSIVLSF